MNADVQSGRMVTYAKSNKLQATLGNKDLGCGKIHNQIIHNGITSCVKLHQFYRKYEKCVYFQKVCILSIRCELK